MGAWRHVGAVLGGVVLAAVVAVLGRLLVPGWYWVPAAVASAVTAVVGLEALAGAARRRPAPAALVEGQAERAPAVRVAVVGVVVSSLVAGGMALGVGRAVEAVRTGDQGPLTRVVVAAAMPDGGRPDATTLERARGVLVRRLSAAGVRGATVQVERDLSGFVLELRTRTPDLVRQLVGAGRLRFRQVVNSVQDTSRATASPSPGASTGPALTTEQRQELQTEVQAKLGAAYQLAGQLTSPSDAQQLGAYLDPFSKLTPQEVSVLPTSMQLNVPQVSCRQLNNRPSGSIDPVNQQVVACGSGYKYLLDKASVVGTDVKSANYTYDSTQGGWKVTLSFKGAGQDKWTNLTKKAYGQTAPANQVAITLDNDVVSAPAIQSVISGDAEITGSFTETQARALAAELDAGALPLTLTVRSVTVVR